jgi:hypothetical protein
MSLVQEKAPTGAALDTVLRAAMADLARLRGRPLMATERAALAHLVHANLHAATEDGEHDPSRLRALALQGISFGGSRH